MYQLILPDNVVSGLRLSSIAIFLVFTIHINIKSILAVILVLGKSIMNNFFSNFQMSSSNLTPDRVLIVDKRLVPINFEQFHFIQLSHPRTKQDQSYAVDHQSQTVFELIQCARSHSSWFINDQHVVPDGSLYLITPINLIFLLLPSLWSCARQNFVSLKIIMNDSLKQLEFDDNILIEKLRPICDIDSKKCLIKLNEENLIKWLSDRIDRLKKHVKDEEHAFDLVCEYLSDDIIEKCQQELKLHGNVRYDIPIGQRPPCVKTTTVTTKKTVEITTKAKRSKK